ncbi:MAG: hypothetical protein FVQ81_03590 [Candidatus Glassbacteria bacterium]|nr:hypothetical protein [Candidatus Glassbacteria bacterium]
MHRFSLKTLTVLFVFFSAVQVYAQQRLNVFNSFEDEAEIAALKLSQGVVVTQSTRYATWRDNSLEVVFPRDGGTIEISEIPGDWRRRSALLTFAWCGQPYELIFTIEDGEGNSYRRSFGLKAGTNHIQLDLRKPQNLNLGNMKSIKINGPLGGKLYLDYIALHDYNEFLEDRGRYDFHYKMDIETPHFKWADPLDGGPLEVYALSGVIDGRAIIELAQRLEINFTTTTMGIRQGMNYYGFGEFYQQRRGGTGLIHTYIADDLYHGPDFDVILWPALQPWETYPQEVRDEIRRQVEEEGKGLVLVYPFTRRDDGAGLWDISPLTEVGKYVPVWPEDQVQPDMSAGDKSPWKISAEHFITRGLALDALPQGQMAVLSSRPAGEVLIETENGIPVLAVRQLGKGRVAAFAYSQRGMIPEIPDPWDTGLHYDYWDYMWSLVARTAVWAAGREPGASIRSLEQQGNKVQVALAGDVPAGRISGRLIDSYGMLLSEIDLPVKAGAKSATVILPDELPGGKNFLDIRLTGPGGSLDWASLTVGQQPLVRVHRLVPSVDRVNLGQEVSATVSLRSSQRQPVKLIAGLYDNYGRLLAEHTEELTVTGDAERTLVFSSAGAASHLAHVRCRVEVKGIVQDRAEAEVFVLQKRVWDDFDIVMYLFGPNPMPGIWPTIDRQMQRMNVTTLSSYPVDHCKHANYMVQAQTRVSGQESPDGGPDRKYYDEMKKKYLATGDKSLLVRKYCLNDPAYRELIRGQLDSLCSPWVPFSPLSYYVYEEPSLTTYGDAVDICFGEHCLAAMREWLKGEYGTLERLNEQWGAKFTGWEQVVPDDHKEAQARGNYSSWADHRTFMERTYAGSYKLILEELRKLDPNAIVLNSGTQESASHNGCDYSLLNQYTLHLNAYQYEVHRSMNPDVKISGGAGYGVIGKYVFRNFYQNLFKGANGGLYIFWQYCTVDPDLTLNQSALDMVEGFDELRGQGIGKLVGLALPDNHGIAVHYSYPSIHGTWIVDGQVKDRVTYDTSPSFDNFQANTSGWLEILRDCGLQFDFIAYSHVEDGHLIDKGYDTFVMPMSVALSDEEIDEIARFVEAGGTVIADALPGVMDEHCAFRNSEKLQKVFGISAPKADAGTIAAAAGEPKLKLKGATALKKDNGKPVLVMNSYGQGKAFLLNYFHHTYSRAKQDGVSGPALENFRTVLSHAGKEPKVRLTGSDGKPVSGCERYLFNNGTTRLLGLVPDMERPEAEQIEIRLDGEYAIYDVRSKRYLGSGDRFRTVIRPGVPRLFAFVTGRITALELQAPASAGLGGEIVLNFHTAGVGDLRSVAVVTVIDPEGNVRGIYGGNRDIEGSTGSSSFRTALNDPAGEWLVEVMETASGERSRKVIRIE